MNNPQAKQRAVLAALGLGLIGVVSGHSYLMSEEGLHGPIETERASKGGEETMAQETVTGKVKELLRNDRNDIDGLSLEGGKEIHFPPHMGASVAKFLKPGDEIKVLGAKVTRPRGEIVFEITQIENQGKTLTIDRPHPPGGPGSKGVRGNQGAAVKGAVMKVTGKIRSFATNRHQDVDGLILEDATEVKLPPHQGRELQALVKIGDEVRIEGHRHETPHGDIHLHADLITAVASGRSIERVDPHRPGHAQPGHARPGHHPEAPFHAPQLDEILNELKVIRQLLEARQPKS